MDGDDSRYNHHGRPLYCGNLDPDVTEGEIFRLFQRHGLVDKVDLKIGFAFIYMADRRDAEDAIIDLRGRKFGAWDNKLTVEWGSQKQVQGHRVFPPSTTLFVANFDLRNTGQHDLRSHCEPYGQLMRVQLKNSFAFVQYTTLEEAALALANTHHRVLRGRTLTVEYTHSADSRDKLRTSNSRRAPSDRGPGSGSLPRSPSQRSRDTLSVPRSNPSPTPAASRRRTPSPQLRRSRCPSRSRDGCRRHSRSRSRLPGPHHRHLAPSPASHRGRRSPSPLRRGRHSPSPPRSGRRSGSPKRLRGHHSSLSPPGSLHDSTPAPSLCHSPIPRVRGGISPSSTRSDNRSPSPAPLRRRSSSSSPQALCKRGGVDATMRRSCGGPRVSATHPRSWSR